MDEPVCWFEVTLLDDVSKQDLHNVLPHRVVRSLKGPTLFNREQSGWNREGSCVLERQSLPYNFAGRIFSSVLGSPLS